ncbi:MAG: 1-acyl-sn-glycerol-3-phosphate acyltransferase [Deltaproteobacteria bacterium]|nr:1-acyl-sn-glycerol-3-phosphate acyltransferase [Deltaproteobacteria bacterium]
MTITPEIDTASTDFPGDPSPQPVFGLTDSLRSIGLWSVGVPHMAAWTVFTVAVSKLTDTRQVDRLIKLMCRAVPKLAGVRVDVLGQETLDDDGTYVYVVNHVNLFDMFVIYQAIPHYTRSLELAEHFDWPLFGQFITAAGQIPVDPKDKRITAKGLKKAAQMLREGDSLVVLPEGERTLDGSVGRFYPGAFRLAIQTGRPVVPMAIKGGRTVSRRGEWRIRPGTMQVIFGAPISTEGLTLKDTSDLGDRCRDIVIDLLQGRRGPGE